MIQKLSYRERKRMPRGITSTSWQSRLWLLQNLFKSISTNLTSVILMQICRVYPTPVLSYLTQASCPRRYAKLQHKLTQLSLICTQKSSRTGSGSGKVALNGCIDDLCNFMVMQHLLTIGITCFCSLRFAEKAKEAEIWEKLKDFYINRKKLYCNSHSKVSPLNFFLIQEV